MFLRKRDTQRGSVRSGSTRGSCRRLPPCCCRFRRTGGSASLGSATLSESKMVCPPSAVRAEGHRRIGMMAGTMAWPTGSAISTARFPGSISRPFSATHHQYNRSSAAVRTAPIRSARPRNNVARLHRLRLDLDGGLYLGVVARRVGDPVRSSLWRGRLAHGLRDGSPSAVHRQVLFAAGRKCWRSGRPAADRHGHAAAQQPLATCRDVGTWPRNRIDECAGMADIADKSSNNSQLITAGLLPMVLTSQVRARRCRPARIAQDSERRRRH